uniref:Uncharacterized protein n=1 Tax=Sphaerodactylus townsendi TaxID=933632 RepID=A0ACB8FFZ0_9SAUR
MEIVDYAYKHDLASWYPEPDDKEAFVRSLIYSPALITYLFAIDIITGGPKEAMETQNIYRFFPLPFWPLKKLFRRFHASLTSAGVGRIFKIIDINGGVSKSPSFLCVKLPLYYRAI